MTERQKTSIAAGVLLLLGVVILTTLDFGSGLRTRLTDDDWRVLAFLGERVLVLTTAFVVAAFLLFLFCGYFFIKYRRDPPRGK